MGVTRAAMKFPWANTLLLVLIAAELVSGFFGLVSGSPREWYFIVAHRISGYGIIVILAWKGANVLFSLRLEAVRHAAHGLRGADGAARRDARPGIRVVFRRPVRLGMVQRRKLAHLRGRGARAAARVARPVPHAGISDRLLGRPPHLPQAGRPRRRRGRRVAGGRAWREGGRAQRRAAQIHRLPRGEQLLRQLLPAHVVAQRRPGARGPGNVAAHRRRRRRT